MSELMPPLETHFQSHAYLMGDDLTVADVAVGSLLNYMPIMLPIDFSAYPAINDYLRRLGERPAFQKVMGRPN